MFTVLSSCDKDLNVSLDQTEDNLELTAIDSMSIYVSTAQLSHLPSTESGVLLIGKNSSESTGSIKSSSYFRLTLENYSNNLPNEAKYDSLNLIIKPNKQKYFYGDTTQNQKISVHRLLEPLVSKNLSSNIGNYNIPIYVQGASIFTDQQFDYEEMPLGEITFRPTISSLDSLNIKLDNQLGEDLFDLIKNNDFRVANTESFQEYLKGMVIRPDEENTCIIGFNDTLELQINYSYIGSDGFRKSESKNIVMGSKAFQYNNIEYDRTGSTFEGLNTSTKELKSELTNGDVLIQGGSGTVAKIQIPSLNDFMHIEDITINKVELVIETKADIHGMYPPPSSLMLFIADKNNNPVSFVPVPFGAANQIQYSYFIPGNTTGKNGAYKFDLINYIKNINEPTNAGNSLMLSVGLPDLFSNVNSMLIAKENNKPKIKLNIVYTKFQ